MLTVRQLPDGRWGVAWASNPDKPWAIRDDEREARGIAYMLNAPLPGDDVDDYVEYMEDLADEVMSEKGGGANERR